jgi:enoyl-CoA hydratase
MPKVSLTMQGPLALVRLDDGKANALQMEMFEQVGGALDALEREACRAVVLEGRAGYFSAGLDLKTLPNLEREPLRRTVRAFNELVARIALFPLPVVCAVSGHAIAGGAILALACDHRVGAAGAFHIGLSETVLGLPLPSCVLELVRQTLPASSFASAVLFGGLFEPEEAARLGLLHEVVAPEHVIERSRERALVASAVEPRAFALTKERLRAEALRGAMAKLDDELDSFLESGPFSASRGQRS